MSKFDLVITTYGVVLAEQAKDSSIFGIQWKRIVLDEAQLIRNHKTESAMSCFKLTGIHRRALSGTPIQNTVDDLFSLLKFIRYVPYDKLEVFKGSLKCGLDNLTRVVEPVLLRRTKANLYSMGMLTALNGKYVHESLIDCNEEETRAYLRISKLTKTLFHQYLEEHTRDKRVRIPGNSGYSQIAEKSNIFGEGIKRNLIFVILLRLPQFCDHPSRNTV